MSKRTLLEIVKSVMSDMDSDAVDSITDTVESEQVASIVRDVYEQMVSDQIVPELITLGKLATVDLLTYVGSINYLEIPDTYTSVDVVKYDIQEASATSPNYASMQYLLPADFMKIVDINKADDDNVTLVTDPGTDQVQYYIKNNTHPKYYTSFDDHFLAFDAIDHAVDTVQLLGTKSKVTAKRVPEWTVDDAFVPDMDENLFPYLIAEAKSTAFVALKQQANPKVDKQSRDQRNRTQGNKFRAKAAQRQSTGSTGPDYGRR